MTVKELKNRLKLLEQKANQNADKNEPIVFTIKYKDGRIVKQSLNEMAAEVWGSDCKKIETVVIREDIL